MFRKMILLVAMIFAAFDLNGFELKEVYLDANKAIGTNRHFFYPSEEEKRGELNLGILSNAGALYSNTLVNSIHTNKQFRYVELDQEFGIDFDKFNVYIQHRSGHALDRQYNMKYPNENHIGLRYYLYKRRD